MTICFHSDWRTPEGQMRAIPDVTTTNMDFLRTCHLLKKMGIRNYAFPLALYDPDLVGVDPHKLIADTEENEILRAKIVLEAKRNGWYYLREIVRIFEQSGDPIPFRLDRGNMAMAWCFFNGLDYFGQQPRQTGKMAPLYSLIKTPTGWIKMGDVEIGTEVSTPDGGTSFIIDIFPQGVKDIYKITLDDGRAAECGLEHLWKVRCEDWGGEYKIFTLDVIRERMQNPRRKHPIMFPVVDPAYPDVVERPLVSIDYVGQEEAQCIMIDHPDHLYITDNYIVTHNTICALTLTSWVIYTHGKTFNMGMVAKDDNLRRENINRIKKMRDSLPTWWVFRDKYKDKNNASEIYYAALDNRYETMVAQSDKAAADKASRGMSPSAVHFDELAFCANIDISYPTILSSTDKARSNSKKNGQPHSNIITTTAGDPSKKEAREAAKILDNSMPFSERLYDCENKEELFKIVSTRSSSTMVNGTFSHNQLGLSNEWLRGIIARNGLQDRPDVVARDYLNRWVSVQEKPIIPKDVLNMINASQMEEKWVEILPSGHTLFWYIDEAIVRSPAFKHRSIVVGSDSSEMIGRDATTLVGIDPGDLGVVFTFRSNEGNLNVVGQMIADLMLKYPGFVLVPESKSTGVGFIDAVTLLLRRSGHNPFHRIFNHVIDRSHEDEFSKYDTNDTSLLDTSLKKYFGFKTNAALRQQLYSTTLLDGVGLAAARIRDATIIRELNSLTNKNGRVDHGDGLHDDSVVALLLAIWFVMNGRHLERYGIKARTAMSLIRPAGNDKGQIEQERQEIIRIKVEALERACRNERDPAMRKMLEADLTQLKDMLKDQPVPTPKNADDLLREPRRFTDEKTVQDSKPYVNSADLNRSLEMVMSFSTRTR